RASLRVLARSCEPHLDETVAGVVEIAAADRDVVVEPGRRRRIDGEQRRRDGLVVVVEAPAILLPDFLALVLERFGLLVVAVGGLATVGDVRVAVCRACSVAWR